MDGHVFVHLIVLNLSVTTNIRQNISDKYTLIHIYHHHVTNSWATRKTGSTGK